jgi:hypothetical protein
MPLSSVDRYNYLAARVALFQIAERLRSFAQFVSPVDDRRYLSRLHEIGQDRHVLFVEFRDVGNEFLAGEP